MTKRILALDFDGVLVDSRKECFVMAVNAYRQGRPGSKAFPVSFEPGKVEETLKENYASLFERYKPIRPYVIDAFSFFVLLNSLEEDMELDSQADYFELRESLKDEKDSFVKAFYDERFSWLEDHPEDWLSLMEPFPLMRSLPKLSEQFELVISTNNDKRPVETIFRKHGIEVKGIFDKSNGSDKRAHLTAISEQFSIPFESILFVDDNLHHLTTTLPLGVTCLFPEWGYHTEEQMQEAEERGLTILHLQDAEQVLQQQTKP